MVQGCFKDVSRMLQVYLKDEARILIIVQGCFMGDSFNLEICFIDNLGTFKDNLSRVE